MRPRRLKSALATRIGAVNLDRASDEDGLPKMLQAAQDAIAGGANQYPPGPEGPPRGPSPPSGGAISGRLRPETEVLVGRSQCATLQRCSDWSELARRCC